MTTKTLAGQLGFSWNFYLKFFFEGIKIENES